MPGGETLPSKCASAISFRSIDRRYSGTEYHGYAFKRWITRALGSDIRIASFVQSQTFEVGSYKQYSAYKELTRECRVTCVSSASRIQYEFGLVVMVKICSVVKDICEQKARSLLLTPAQSAATLELLLLSIKPPIHHPSIARYQSLRSVLKHLPLRHVVERSSYHSAVAIGSMIGCTSGERLLLSMVNSFGRQTERRYCDTLSFEISAKF
jgi:hypothetical protein